MSIRIKLPLKEIKVSLPQHLAQPVVKWGRPAAIEREYSSKQVEGRTDKN